MSRVFLKTCRSYDPNEVGKAVEAALSSVLGDGAGDLEGKKVLLKPNLAGARKPERAVTTHPEIVGAAIDYCRRFGAQVYVGDSPAGAVRGVTRVWENTGMLAVCGARGATLVNFEAGGWLQECVEGRTYRIARAIHGFDYVVNIPKFKTHILTLLTGAIKNMFGCVPGFGKSSLHLLNPRPAGMSKILVDIFSIVRPWVSLVDAVEAMEGNGPSSGRVRHLGFVAASRDAVALDAILAEIVGVDPLKVPTTREAYGRGLGEGSLDRIAVDGAALRDVAGQNFEVPSNWQFGLVPDGLARLVARWFWVRPLVHESKCIGCGDCVGICAASAINLNCGKAVVDRGNCVSCLCCIEACAAGAIEPRMSRLARFAT